MHSKNIKYLPGLDHLRFLAVLLVLVFHTFHFNYWNWRPATEHMFIGPISEGHTGVTLFFVLSGFIFMLIAQSTENINYREFVRNRLLRIFPLFLFFFFIAISIGREEFRPQDIFYLLFSNLGKAPTSSNVLTGTAWTISVEFTFYLIFPFLAVFTKEKGVKYLFAILVLLLLVKLAAFGVSDRPKFMYYSTLIGRMDQFIIGMIAAIAYTQLLHRFEKYKFFFLILSGLAVYIGLCYQAVNASWFAENQKQGFWVFWGTLEATLWATFTLFYLLCSAAIPKKISQLLAFGGSISYSAYLWQMIVIFLVHRAFGPINIFDRLWLNFLVTMLLVFPLTMLVAFLSYYAIEKPFLNLRRNYSEK